MNPGPTEPVPAHNEADRRCGEGLGIVPLSERRELPPFDGWKLLHRDFLEMWLSNDVEGMDAWQPKADLEYDPNWEAPLPEDIDEIEAREPERAALIRAAKRESTRRYHQELYRAPEKLAPTEEVSDFYIDGLPFVDTDGYGPTAMAVQGRLASSTAGWKRRPDAAEFHEAVLAGEPTLRQRNVIRVFVREATEEEWVRAWAEGAFTWRNMYRHMHAFAHPPEDKVALLNTHALSRITPEQRARMKEWLDDPWEKIRRLRRGGEWT